MGKIKGWSKSNDIFSQDENYSQGVVWIGDNNKRLFVINRKTYDFGIEKDWWRVVVNKYVNGGPRKIYEKEARNKTHALKIARQYMRRNP